MAIETFSSLIEYRINQLTNPLKIGQYYELDTPLEYEGKTYHFLNGATFYSKGNDGKPNTTYLHGQAGPLYLSHSIGTHFSNLIKYIEMDTQNKSKKLELGKTRVIDYGKSAYSSINLGTYIAPTGVSTSIDNTINTEPKKVVDCGLNKYIGDDFDDIEIEMEHPAPLKAGVIITVKPKVKKEDKPVVTLKPDVSKTPTNGYVNYIKIITDYTNKNTLLLNPAIILNNIYVAKVAKDRIYRINDMAGTPLHELNILDLEKIIKKVNEAKEIVTLK